jgi:hypothetical protein
VLLTVQFTGQPGKGWTRPPPPTRGGRWAVKDGCSVLYTSLTEDGALAELSFHWSQLNPLPSKPAALHELEVGTQKTLHLVMADLVALGVEKAGFPEISYTRCQEIGEAVGFLGYDGLMVPSARWNCEDLVLFTEHHSLTDKLMVLSTREIDWKSWAADNGLL